ncbi:Alpha/beta hydrolase OS=Streptomyces fumanus OX=67302 GN=GCM10018772_62080 PE=4 SV=1 [Streptomyces fumanus]
MFTTRMLALSERYPLSALDHTFVNVDASEVYVRGHRLNPAGAHSDHVRLESAHLLLTLADYSR